MVNFNIVFYLLFLSISFTCIGQQLEKSQEIQSFQISDDLVYNYTKPKFFDMLKYLPKDVVEFGKTIVQKQNLVWTGSAIGATALMIPIDQKLVDEATNIGAKINFDGDHTYGSLGPLRIIPNDIKSGVYYLGNGGTTMILCATFYSIGAIGNDYRALNTSSELVEVLLATGILTQTIKRITGRQSPFKAAETGDPGGQWSPFPSFKAYQTNTSNYDAMPSGHLTTFMATLTVIAANYPEIKWIKPVGYTLMGIMAFEMMSTQVHWASDYPLALLIGYFVGKTASDRRIKKAQKINDSGMVNPSKIRTDYNIGQLGKYKTFGITLSF